MKWSVMFRWSVLLSDFKTSLRTLKPTGKCKVIKFPRFKNRRGVLTCLQQMRAAYLDSWTRREVSRWWRRPCRPRRLPFGRRCKPSPMDCARWCTIQLRASCGRNIKAFMFVFWKLFSVRHVNDAFKVIFCAFCLLSWQQLLVFGNEISNVQVCT